MEVLGIVGKISIFSKCIPDFPNIFVSSNTIIAVIYCILNLILLGKIGRGLETNSTFEIGFTKLPKVNPKHCSVPPCFEKKMTNFILPPHLTYNS